MHTSLRPLRLAAVLSVTLATSALPACTGADDEAELAAIVDDAAVIFHVGCAERSALSTSLCEEERRVCGDVLTEAAAALRDGPIVVEFVIDNVESASLLTWQIQPDGAGTLYAERGTDFPLECVWGACGLNKTTFSAGELVDDDGAIVLRPAPAHDALDTSDAASCE